MSQSTVYRSLVILLVLSFVGSCSTEIKMETADQIFRSELDKRAINYSIAPEGLYEIELEDQKLTVSLSNICRNFERDGDADAIIRFVDKLGSDPFAETPRWEFVQPYVRYSLEPSDYETGFDDILFNTVTEGLNQVFVYTPADGSRITWINISKLEYWNVTREQLSQRAEENMAKILANTRFEVEDIDDNKLGMIATEETPFKASLILSPAFRNLVSPTHGWPVYVVVPCRDFAYVIREDNHEFLERLGGVVIKEYNNSGHSITKDVLKVSDDGITVIGTYPEPE